MSCGVGIVREEPPAGSGASVVCFDAVPRRKAIVGLERGFFAFCFWSLLGGDDFRSEFLDSDSFFVRGALLGARS